MYPLRHSVDGSKQSRDIYFLPELEVISTSLAKGEPPLETPYKLNRAMFERALEVSRFPTFQNLLFAFTGAFSLRIKMLYFGRESD